MAISFNKAVGLYESALKLRSSRAEILASNLANADTPHYKARDLNFQQALNAQTNPNASPQGLSLTQSAHQNAAGGAFSNTLVYRTPSQPSLDGNTVEEQLEHSAFMENSLQFQTTFTLLNSRFKGLMAAIKGE